MTIGDLVGFAFICTIVFVPTLVLGKRTMNPLVRALESGDYSQLPERVRRIFARRGIKEEQYGSELYRIVNAPLFRFQLRHPILAALITALFVYGVLRFGMALLR